MEGAFNELGVGRYNRLLQRLLDMKADPPAPTLAGELFAGITLESDRPEWAYLGGVQLLGAFADVAAVVGQPGNFRIRNPANSGALVILEAVLVSTVTTGAGFTFSRGTATANFATVHTNVFRDSRSGTTGGVAGVSSTTNAAVAGTAFAGIALLANTPFDPFSSLVGAGLTVLAQGSSFDISWDANVRALITVLWRERPAEQSER